MIHSPLLPAFGGLIGGRWAASDSADSVHVHNPASGELLARVSSEGAGEAEAAIAAAEQALAVAADVAQRRDWLLRIERHLLAERQECARLITLENGKPLKEAVTEVEYAAGFFRYFAHQFERLDPETLPETIRGCRWTIHRRAAGVVALITPWNFPLAMLAKKVSAALAAGCAFVARPSELTPLSAIALCHLAQRAGVPAGRANLVLGKAGPIAEVFCRHPGVRMISFTGSTEVGRRLIAESAPSVKRLALELGGNAPFIVFADADLAVAARALIANKFRASGQTCVCTNRVYVQASMAEAFTALVVERVRPLRVGDGLDPATDLGPLIHRAAFDKVSAHVQDALMRGARRLAGSDPARPAHEWGAFYPPTVLADVTADMLVCTEETFGPVVSIATFATEAEVVAAANATWHGLAAYVFTRNEQRLERVLPQLRFGHVGVNTGSGPTPEAPFGGMKQSGFGREGGVDGLFEFCETQGVAEAQAAP